MVASHWVLATRERVVLNSELRQYVTGTLDRFLAWRSLRTFYVLSAIFFTSLLFHFDLVPLEETHWDAPIYVALSKQAAETNLLTSYRQHAHDIQLGPGDEHWHFTRIGHILLLGEVTRLFGSTENALVAMQWLYRTFMALSVTLCVVFGLRIVNLFRSIKPDTIWWIGYLFAAITYVVSDGYRGLQGHLLSEPPAFLILILFALVLLRAVERRSLLIGASAGCLLFLLFFIRIDAVLPGVVFLAVLLAALVILRKFDAVSSALMAGLVSLVLYSIYAWWFTPLVNPQTLVNFSAEAKEMFLASPAQNLFAIGIAGGLLWVGALSAVRMWRDPVICLSIVWLGLALLPMVIDSLNGRLIQARMAFFIVPPLLILAGEGWSWILREAVTQRKLRPLAVALSLVVIMTSVPYSLIIQESRSLAINYLPPEISQYLFSLPSKNTATGSLAPRYEDTRLGLLVRPVYERWTLEYSKARQIGDYLYIPERPAYLLWSRAKFPGQHSLQNYIGLFRYFGKQYPENADIVMTKLPNRADTEPCTTRVPTDAEPIVFCTNFLSSDLETAREKRIPVYVLGIDEYPMPDMPSSLALKVLLSVPPFVLYEIAE
ncbi:MAG: hypothetical protein KBA82_03875 [Nitrosomonas sp.]|nr:hypothetical protein [Nitrosomonas sp.]MBP7112108.1 hypothetical protein [Nitrosomonas sp.]